MTELPSDVADPFGLPRVGADFQPRYDLEVDPLPGLGVQRVDPAYRGEYVAGGHGQWDVRYLTPEARAQMEVRVENGRLIDASGQPYQSGGQFGWFNNSDSIWVMSTDGRMYAYGGQSVGTFHHSSFLAGEPTSGAGHVTVENGRVTQITDMSGHYRPSLETSIAAIRHMQAQGLDLSQAQFSSWHLQQPVSVADLLAGNYQVR